MIAEATAVTPEGVHVAVLLHVRDGVLSELELYASHGPDLFTLPAADAVTDIE